MIIDGCGPVIIDGCGPVIIDGCGPVIVDLVRLKADPTIVARQ